jgi:hypothetical protein
MTMAKKTVETYFSDLSGAQIDGSAPTTHFAVDGRSYEIDLTPAEKAALDQALAPYVAAARPAAGTRRARSSTPSGVEPRAVRAWAAEQGIDVPARGRVPASVVEAYTAAH